jgi:hypothetical protein
MWFAAPTAAAQFAMRVAAESNLSGRAAQFIRIADGINLSEVPQNTAIEIQPTRARTPSIPVKQSCVQIHVPTE